jgi:chaperonin GroES
VTAAAHPHRIPNRAAWHILADAVLRPTEDRVLVRPDPRQHRLESGLWLPETAEDEARAQTGTVVGVGPKRADITSGDRVLYRQWGGTECIVGGEDLLILEPRDVFAVIEETT